MTFRPVFDHKVTFPGKQQGVALILVIFMTVLIVIITAGITKQVHLFVRKSANLFTQAQAVDLAVSAESFARLGLTRDFDEDNKNGKMIDHEKEVWAEYAATFPMELGTIEMQVDDLQGRFNINDLIDQNGKVKAVVLKRFQALLDVLGIVSITAEKVADWVDADEQSYDYKGAEDDVYLIEHPPYRTANFEIGDISELLMVQGIDYEEYEKLLPHISALPRGTTGLNVNTCSRPLLRALVPTLTEEMADSIIETRRQDAFKTVNEFLKQPGLERLKDKTNLTVSTHYFRISARVSISDTVARLVSKVYRDDDGQTILLGRDFGQKDIINKPLVLL
ncbi:MAG: general secretion pathway protein GspK [Proteobacteria bacterium]|nr:MAG: general secretion pathway protein GspK [Pseudomonadota bacterium]